MSVLPGPVGRIAKMATPVVGAIGSEITKSRKSSKEKRREADIIEEAILEEAPSAADVASRATVERVARKAPARRRVMALMPGVKISQRRTARRAIRARR